MQTRFLVLYYDGNHNKAALVDAADGSFPFGVNEAKLGEALGESEEIMLNAIVEVGSTQAVPTVVIDDEEAELPVVAYP